MFQSDKRAGGTRDAGITIISSGCHFNGKLYCKGSTRIGGRIDGQVHSEGILVIEEEAMVNGEILADDIIVHGQIFGTVEARRRIELTQSAQASADIQTATLVVHEGARFNGSSRMKEVPQQEHKGKGKIRAVEPKLTDVPHLDDKKAARISDASLAAS